MASQQRRRLLRRQQQAEEQGSSMIDKIKSPESERGPESNIKIEPIKKNSIHGLHFAEEVIGFHGGAQKKSGFKLALWTWLSATIDTFILISTSCFFMIVFSFLMQTPAKSFILQLFKQPQLISVFAGSFTLSLWTYLIFTRIFMGASLGEWTCNLRLGKPIQRTQMNNLFKVILRTTLVLGTGVVVIPLISLVVGRDIAGEITGIKIYSLK